MSIIDWFSFSDAVKGSIVKVSQIKRSRNILSKGFYFKIQKEKKNNDSHQNFQQFQIFQWIFS